MRSEQKKNSVTSRSRESPSWKSSVIRAIKFSLVIEFTWRFSACWRTCWRSRERANSSANAERCLPASRNIGCDWRTSSGSGIRSDEGIDKWEYTREVGSCRKKQRWFHEQWILINTIFSYMKGMHAEILKNRNENTLRDQTMLLTDNNRSTLIYQ